MEENSRISTESIYRLILKDKAAKGRYIDTCAIRVRNIASVMASTITEGRIPNRVDIADRPRIVDNRSRIGVVIEGES